MDAPFEVDGGFVTEGGMTPAGIVPAIDELEDGHARLGLGLELALAEQDAIVTGIDIDEGALRVARDRSTIYGIEAEFKSLNADGMADAFRDRTFDLIIFFASLEHLTMAERLISLRDAWEMLRVGGQLVIVETPNRLWYFDTHTAMLPFFHWLPDELAFQYTRFSPRKPFCDSYREYSPEMLERFLRQGRGVSFHEFDIAISPARDLKVVSSLGKFQGLRGQVEKTTLDRRYKSVLMDLHRGLHEGFFDKLLYLIIEKE